MKRLALALALFLAPFASAMADGCQQAPVASFIADANAALKDGTVKGVAIEDGDVKAFAKEIGMPENVDVKAIIFVDSNDTLIMFVAFVNAAGQEGVCFGEPGDKVVAAFKAYLVRRAA